MGDKFLLNRGTAIVFRPGASAGQGYEWDVQSLGVGAGYRSIRAPLAAVPRPDWYEVDWEFEFNAALTPNNVVMELYAVGADAAAGSGDGSQAETDASLAAESELNQLKFIGAVIADSAVAGRIQKGHAILKGWTKSYIQVVGWIPAVGTVALSADVAKQKVTLTPVWRESVAA